MGVYNTRLRVYNRAMPERETEPTKNTAKGTMYARRRTADSDSDRRRTSTRKEGGKMPLSDARKRANKKWDKANMKRFAVDLRNEVFEEVEQERKKRDMSRADVIIDWLSHQKK